MVATFNRGSNNSLVVRVANAGSGHVNADSIQFSAVETTPQSAWTTTLFPPVGRPPDTIGIYNGGQFFLSSDNQNVLTSFYFGPGGSWLPAAGDWDGNGVDSIGITLANEVNLSNNNQTV